MFFVLLCFGALFNSVENLLGFNLSPLFLTHVTGYVDNIIENFLSLRLLRLTSLSLLLLTLLLRVVIARLFLALAGLAFFICTILYLPCLRNFFVSIHRFLGSFTLFLLAGHEIVVYTVLLSLNRLLQFLLEYISLAVGVRRHKPLGLLFDHAVLL